MQSILKIAPQIIGGLVLFGSVIVWLRVARRKSAGLPIVPYEPHRVVPWSGWDVLLLVAMLLMLLASGVRGSASNLEGDAPQLSINTIAMASAANLIWLAVAVTYLSSRVGAYFDDMGFDLRKVGSDVALGVQAFLAAVLPVYAVQLVLTQFIPSEHPLAKLAREEPTWEVLTLATVVAVVLAPLFEEFMFRVLLQSWFEKLETVWRDPQGAIAESPAGWMPILVVSALFGLSHWGHGPDPAALFVLSLFLGYTYQQTHRIIAPLTLHVCFNSLAMLELWLSAGEKI